MTVDEALEFFSENHEEKIVTKLKPLQDVGLGYLQLGQSSSTLSGGEAQRVKTGFVFGKGATTEKTFSFSMNRVQDCIFMILINF